MSANAQQQETKPENASVSIKAQLLEKINTATATIAVVGMGYVGLPLAVCLANIGFKVIGLDVNPRRVAQLNDGKSYIDDVKDNEFAPLVEQQLIQADTDFSRVAEADVVVICVPTPLTKNQTPDITYIQASTEAIAEHMRPGQLITLESTTYPGTTEEVMLPILEKSGLTVGEDFFIAHSPERVDPGNARYTTHNTNKVVGGYTEACQEVAGAFYKKSILDIISVSSPGCAEMVKVFENTFRAVNIALVNELALLCDKMDLNVWEVVEAAGTKPFGMLTFWPGPGVGGHCIPIDPFYLTWKAKEYGFHTRFIELAGEINTGMPRFVREKIIRALGRVGKPLYGARILILGVAYKRDLRDWRHSPGMDLLHVLHEDDAQVFYNDPFVPEVVDNTGTRHYSVDLNPDTLAEADCVVVVTDHTPYDYDFIVKHSHIVVDTRNATKNVFGEDDRKKIILL